MQHDKEKNECFFLWKGRWVSLVPLQLITSPSTSSPSIEEPKEERKEETNIKANIEKQDQRMEDVVTKSDETSCSTPRMDNTSEVLEDNGSEILSVANTDQKMQPTKELVAII